MPNPFKGLFKPKPSKKRGDKHPDLKRNIDPSELWEIVGELGDGAFGKVYKAERHDNGELAALKKIDIDGEDELDEYMVEVYILTACQHKNIVGIKEAFFYESHLWLYIEFCGGGALDSIMVNLEKPLTELQIRYVTHEVCQGLQFIHESRVIHRDLKAGNILLTSDGEIRLADFGVSAMNTKTAGRNSFIGTPYWMAPEVIACETEQDMMYTSKADIWSLGATLIELAEMNPPNHEMHPMRVLIKIQKATPPTLQDVKVWSETFHDFLTKCLKKEPNSRLSASELLQHPFIKDSSDSRPIRELVAENRADVIEEEEKLNADEEYKRIKDESSSNAGTDTDSLTTEEESDRGIDDTLNEAFGNLSDNQSVGSKSSNESDATESSNAADSTHLTVPLPTITVLPPPSVSNAAVEHVSEISLPTEKPDSEDPDGDSRIAEEIQVDDPITPNAITNIDDIPEINYNIKKSEDEMENQPKEKDNGSHSPVVVNVDEANFTPESVITDIDRVIAEHDISTPDSSAPTSPVPASSNLRPQEELDNNLPSQSLEEELLAAELVTNIIDEVIDSDLQQPSISEVVLKTIDEVTQAEEPSASPKSPDISATDNGHGKESTDPVAQTTSIPIVVNGGEKQSSTPSQSQPIVYRKKKPADENENAKETNKDDGHYRTLKKTRKFIVDGKEVTTTSKKIVAGEDDQKNASEYQNRKLDLRELKILQKEENRQYQDLMRKGMSTKEVFDRQCQEEFAEHNRIFQNKLEALARSHKAEMEKSENLHATEIRNHQRKMKGEQDREIKNFEKELKQEKKLFEAEISHVKNKSEKRNQKNLEWEEKRHTFREKQTETMDTSMRRLAEAHKQKIALLEKQWLQQKQQLLREQEAITWEIEEKQQHERYQMNKRLLKDFYYLRRCQMFRRHDKEREQQKRNQTREEDEMTRRHHADKKRLPGILKREAATRQQMFKQSLRISMITSGEEEKEKIKRFDENEKMRMKAESRRQLIKQQKQWEELKARNNANERELEQSQNEKRTILVEQETEKIRQSDMVYQQELANWKANIIPRKQTLEEDFLREQKEQEIFYGPTLWGTDSLSSNGQSSGDAVNKRPSGSNSVRSNSRQPSRTSTVI